VFLIGVSVLLLPLVVGVVVRGVSKINILDNPDFLYGYMGYFGTVALAIVSWVQSIKTEETSNRFMTQQLRQKIGYFGLKENTREVGKSYLYQPLQVGQFLNADGVDDHSKDKTIGIWVKNVGEDIILNVSSVLGKINGQIVNISCSISVVYKDEEIAFELDNTQHFQENNLKIEFIIKMKNVSGISYNQSFYISAQKNDETQQGTYIIQEFDTQINF